MRLNRYLASCGLGSRRGCEAIIKEGRVSVGGRIQTDLSTQVSPDDRVEVDGHADMDLGNRLTLSTWARIDGFVDGAALMAYGDTSDESFALITNIDGSVSFKAGAESINGGSIASGQWHHLRHGADSIW